VLLSISAEHAEAIRDFPELVRHDPFGLLLVAQASRAGLRLLTADQILLGLDSVRGAPGSGPWRQAGCCIP
jgi:PIN domain nuclease of toxin-antitoxin system